DRRLGPIDEVERAALVEERRGGRIQVLGTVFGAVVPRAVRTFTEDPPAEPDRAARRVADRVDDPAAEPVVDAKRAGRSGAATARGQSDHLELVGSETALLDESLRQLIPGVRRVSQLEGRDRLVGDASPVEI